MSPPESHSQPVETRINHRPVTELELAPIVEAQRRFFRTGATRPEKFRRDSLERLRALVEDNEARFYEALHADMGKPAFESYMSEVGFIRAEIRYVSKRLGSWMKPERVGTPLYLLPAKSFIQREPLGVVLIISPWNYPVLLVLSPLIGALAAGNCAIVKPSEWAVHTSDLLSELLSRHFPPEIVTTVTGGADASRALLEHAFDHVFFTGSVAVGKKVAAAAAKHLTPVTLELGGKSPCIVDEDADLDFAARRIVWGKYLNAGQTCTAPDYLLAPAGRKEALLEAMRRHVREFFGPDPSRSPDYGRILNRRHFDRIRSYLDQGRVLIGGETDAASLYIAPSVLDEIAPGAPVMEEEIFGPILPLLSFESLDGAIEQVTRHPNPLALYFFSKSSRNQERVRREVAFGGGAINDTLVQFSNPSLPFGGRGSSGIGRYHGRFSFDTFSHHKGIVRSSTLFDPPLRYPPYEGKLRWLKKLLK